MEASKDELKLVTTTVIEDQLTDFNRDKLNDFHEAVSDQFGPDVADDLTSCVLNLVHTMKNVPNDSIRIHT